MKTLLITLASVLPMMASAQFPLAVRSTNGNSFGWTNTGVSVFNGQLLGSFAPPTNGQSVSFNDITNTGRLFAGFILGPTISGVPSTNVVISSVASTVPTGTPSEFLSGNTIIGGRTVTFGGGGNFAWQNLIVSCSSLNYAAAGWSVNNFIGDAVGGTIGSAAGNAGHSFVWGGGGSVTLTNTGTLLFSDGNAARRTLNNYQAAFYFQNGFLIGGGTALITTKSNLLAPASVSVGASPVSITNTFSTSAFFFIAGGTVSQIDINGQAISTGSLTELSTIPLQTNEWMTLTYSIAPTVRWKPY